MPLFKGKDMKTDRERGCGCMVTWYPVKPENDLLDWIVVERKTTDEEKWSMQMHSHPDFEEYWFVLEGKGQIICGNETYDVEPGDLVITPRGVPHKARGDMKFICTCAKHNVYGKTIGPKMQYVAADEPYRDDPSVMAKIGVYNENDLTEKGK